jgi:hypothetical protein
MIVEILLGLIIAMIIATVLIALPLEGMASSKLPVIPIGAVLHAVVVLQPLTGNLIDDIVADLIEILLGTGTVQSSGLSAHFQQAITYALQHPSDALIGASINGVVFGLVRAIARKFKSGITIPEVCRITF